MSTLPTEVTLPVVWQGMERLPVLVTNQMLAQLSGGPDGRPEECIVTLGYAAPPILLGNPEEQAAALHAFGAVSVQAHVRSALSRLRLQELIGVLTTVAAQWDDSERKANPT